MLSYYKPFNTALNSDEMKVNAKFVWNYLGSRGWSLDAVCGVLGNFEAESTINPNRVENSQKDRWPNWGNYGFGVAQWTPWYTKQKPDGSWYDAANYHGSNNPTYGYWAEQNGYTVAADGSGTIGNFEPQLDYLNANLGTSSGKTWVQNYKTTSAGPEQAAKDFYVYYEKSEAGTWGTRPAKALKWYEYLSGSTPHPPIPTKRKTNFIILAYGSGLIK